VKRPLGPAQVLQGEESFAVHCKLAGVVGAQVNDSFLDKFDHLSGGFVTGYWIGLQHSHAHARVSKCWRSSTYVCRL